eukprot:352507-Chlamydomonas_euryale.AAC.2
MGGYVHGVAPHLAVHTPEVSTLLQHRKDDRQALAKVLQSSIKQPKVWNEQLGPCRMAAPLAPAYFRTVALSKGTTAPFRPAAARCVDGRVVVTQSAGTGQQWCLVVCVGGEGGLAWACSCSSVGFPGSVRL